MTVRTFTIIFMLFLTSCASTDHVSRSYSEFLEDHDHRTSKRTVVFFLIDGFSLRLATRELNNGRLPQIKKYFVNGKKGFNVARTTFPSLTYPAITSLLTRSPIDQNEIFGNIILSDNKIYNFESPTNYSQLNKIIQGKNIFSYLQAQGLKAVSLDFAFHSDASAHMQKKDADAALAILGKDYSYLDTKLIRSLEILLSDTAYSQWPDFIFIHLVGLDFISHESGPDSLNAAKYLRHLDAELESVFTILNQAEKSKKRDVIAMMSSDHGFDQKVSRNVNISKAFEHIAPDVEVINEGRFAGLYFPSYWDPERRSSFLQSLVANQNIDIVAEKINNSISIKSHQLETQILYGSGTCHDSAYTIAIVPGPKQILRAQSPIWMCPDQLEPQLNNLYYPYFLSHLSHYFQSPGHPDAVVISKSGVAFESVGAGQHGGPTTQEVFVPLFLHNLTLAPSAPTPALWQLLNFL